MQLWQVGGQGAGVAGAANVDEWRHHDLGIGSDIAARVVIEASVGRKEVREWKVMNHFIASLIFKGWHNCA